MLAGVVFFVAMLALGTLAAAQLLLAEPESETYYRYVAVAGGDVKLNEVSLVEGDLHANADIELKSESRVEGDVSATNEVDVNGDVTGTVTEGAAALTLPAIDEAAFRQRAGRFFDTDVRFENETIDDVVFVDGEVEIATGVDGIGTVFATGNVRVRADDSDSDSDSDSNAGSGSGATAPSEQRLSIITLRKITIEKASTLRGVLRAGRDIKLEKDSAVEGVAIADGKIELKKGAALRFLPLDTAPPTMILASPDDGGVVDTATPAMRVLRSMER